MGMYKRRPQLARFEILSPPSAEILHAGPNLPASERAAKRRRIESYAQDCLEGKEIFIASAALKGPFDEHWVNPWRTPKLEMEHEGEVQKLDEAVRSSPALEAGRRRAGRSARPPLVGREQIFNHDRPTSKGSDYCHDWLRRQQARSNSPDLEDDLDKDTDVESSTPTKNSRKNSKALPRMAEFASAWTASHSNSGELRARSGSPNNYPRLDSLQVDVGSSIGPRLLQSQSPPSFPKRMLARVKSADMIDDTTLTKVSLISEDVSIVKSRELEGVWTREISRKHIESPGFFFRRVGEGQRPGSRGSNLINGIRERPGSRGTDATKPSTTEADPKEPVLPSLDESAAQEGWLPNEDLNIQEPYKDTQMIAVTTNNDGKWPCPMKDCQNRPKPYASRSGLANHLKTRHDIHRTATEGARTALGTKLAPKKPAKKTKAVPKTAQLELVKFTSDSIEDGNDAREDILVAPAVGEAQQVTKAVEQEPAAPAQEKLSPSPSNLQAGSPENALDVPVADEMVTEVKQAAPIVAEAVSVVEDQPIVQEIQQEPRQERATESINIGEPTPNDTEPDLPDRQDSKAYSTFTLNLADLSTQAALLQAHQAFQETQSPEKENEYNVAEDLANQFATPTVPLQGHPETVTPFRKPSLNLSQSQIPSSILRVVPASTQDLMNAAAGLTFSTAKKPKKRISFADWPVVKPSQPNPSLKPVEWSPYIAPPYRPRSPSPNGEEGEITITSHPITSFSRIVENTSATPNDLYKMPSANELLFTMPKSSALTGTTESEAPPVPSYQPGQGGLDSQDIENALDEAVSFLSTWDVDKEIARNTVPKKVA